MPFIYLDKIFLKNIIYNIVIAQFLHGNWDNVIITFVWLGLIIYSPVSALWF